MKFLLAMLFMSQVSFAGDGREGGGGIILSAEFAKIGRDAINILSQGDASLDFAEITESVKDTKIIPVEKICYTVSSLGIEYCEDAHYDKTNNLILFNQTKWSQLTCKEKLVLTTHEYLRVSGLEGEDYTFSGRFISRKIAQCRSDSSEEQLKCSTLALTLERQVQVMCELLNQKTK